MMPQTLIFGGTFNPVHVGHLRAAVEVVEALGFDRAELVPSYAPLHKVGDALLPFDLRVAMLRAALVGLPRFSVNEIEKNLPVPSVTVQTLEAMARDTPEEQRHFLLGDREFLRLHKWRRGADVVKLAHIVVVCRTEFDPEKLVISAQEAWPEFRRLDAPAGALMAFELLPGRRAVLMRVPRIDISSSLVRRRWLEGRSLALLVPSGAIGLLEKHRDEVDAIWKRAAISPSGRDQTA